MKAKDFMTKNVITANSNLTIGDAAILMAQNGFSVLPVVDANFEIVGIITESDFVGKEKNIPHALASIKQLFGQIFYFREIEEIYEQSKGKKLSEVMSTKVFTIPAEASLTEIVNFMISKGLKRLPVVEGKKLVGIITRKDMLKAFNMITK
jgi:CBS domain-containing protein